MRLDETNLVLSSPNEINFKIKVNDNGELYAERE